MAIKRLTGEFAPFFFMAATFDLVGFILLLVGMTQAPQIDGRWYGDFLELTGAVLMFLGLGFWVLWYAGNIGADGKRISRKNFARLSRKFTERLSSMRWRGDSWKAREREEEEEEEEEEKKEMEKEQVKENEKEVEMEMDNEGECEKNGAYTNDAYEPTDNEIV